MGFIDWVRDFATSRGYYGKEEFIEDIDDDDDDIDEGNYGAERYVVAGHTAASRNSAEHVSLPPLSQRSRNMRTADSYLNEPHISARNNKIVDINSNVVQKSQVVIFSPQTIEEASEICDLIIEHKMVSVNLETVEHAISQRIVDFLCGSAYSLGGSIQSTGSRTFLIAPKNVDITNNLKDELKAGGISFAYKTAKAR